MAKSSGAIERTIGMKSEYNLSQNALFFGLGLKPPGPLLIAQFAAKSPNFEDHHGRPQDTRRKKGLSVVCRTNEPLVEIF